MYSPQNLDLWELKAAAREIIEKKKDALVKLTGKNDGLLSLTLIVFGQVPICEAFPLKSND